MFDLRGVYERIPKFSVLSSSYAADPERNEASRLTKKGLWQDFETRVGALKGEKKWWKGQKALFACKKARKRLMISLQLLTLWTTSCIRK